MKKIIKGKSGLSLIEVVAAVAIFSIMVGPLAGFLYVSNQRGRQNVIARQALVVAESRIESLRQVGFRDFVLSDNDDIVVVEETEGKFLVVTESRYDESVGMAKLTVTVSHNNVQVSLSTYISQYRR